MSILNFTKVKIKLESIGNRINNFFLGDNKQEKYQKLNLTIDQLIVEADSRNHYAQAQLSLEYFIGNQCPRDLGKAFKYLELSSKDYYAVNMCYKTARESGEPAAYFGIAMMWKHGWGVPESIEMYSKNIILAANLGYPRAQLLLGLNYKMNIYGVQEDLTQSEYWLKKAVESDVDDAHIHLFHLYIHESIYDKEKANYHLLTAGNLNDGMAQIYLGRHYNEGRIFNKDFIEATKWFILAEEHNHWKFNDLDELRETLTINEMDEAKQRVKDWKMKFAEKNDKLV